jgi:uncharacterized protein
VEAVLIFARRHPTSVAAFALVAALAGGYLVSRISFDADILRLLPQRSPTVRSFEQFLRRFGSLDHLYLVFEASEGIGDHVDLVDAYVDALRKASEIESVDAQLFEPGKDWSYLTDRVLFLLGPDGAREALMRLQPPRLDQELEHARDLLSIPSPQVKGLVQQDPVGLLTFLRDRMSREKGMLAFDPTQEGYVSQDGRSRLVVVKPRGAPFDTDFCKQLFRRLSEIERDARDGASAIDPDASRVTIRAAGAYRVSLEAEQLIRREGIVNSVGSMVLLLLFVFALFRTPWMVLYGIVPLTLAALLTLGIAGQIQGSLSPATSGSAGMLFGLGIDGVVMLYLRYLEERNQSRPPEEATRRMSGTAVSVVLAQGTTAATFGALLLVDFPTLQDLGLLVGVGILLCCMFTLLVLPVLLSWRSSAESGRMMTSSWLGRFVTARAAAILAVGGVATIMLGVAAFRLRLDASITRLQAQTPGAELEREVAAKFSLPQDVLLVLNDHDRIDPLLDTDARLTRALAAHMPSVAASGITFMLPSSGDQNAVATVLADSRVTGDRVRGEVELAAARAGFRPGVFAPFVDRLPRLLDPAERITFDGLVAHGLDSIVSRFVVRAGDRYESVTYLYPRGQVDIAQLDRLVHDVDPSLRLTGLPVINHELGQRFPQEFLRGLAIGTVAVAVLIYLVFCTVRHTLLAMVPTAVGFVWSAGLLALARVELDLFSLFAAVTFVGVAVDYGIYILYRYVFEPPRDIGRVLTHTGAAITIACVTALIGFGSLVNSSYAPLRTFGIVSLVTLTCCLLASVVFLPALVLRTSRWL